MRHTSINLFLVIILTPGAVGSELTNLKKMFTSRQADTHILPEPGRKRAPHKSTTPDTGTCRLHLIIPRQICLRLHKIGTPFRQHFLTGKN